MAAIDGAIAAAEEHMKRLDETGTAHSGNETPDDVGGWNYCRDHFECLDYDEITGECGGRGKYLHSSYLSDVTETNPCVRPCVERHERVHELQCQGYGGAAFAALTERATDMPAYRVERDCLRKLKVNPDQGCPPCP